MRTVGDPPGSRLPADQGQQGDMRMYFLRLFTCYSEEARGSESKRERPTPPLHPGGKGDTLETESEAENEIVLNIKRFNFDRSLSELQTDARGGEK